MLLTTIRSTLLTLIGMLAAALLIVVTLQLIDLRAVQRDAQSQIDASLARDSIARAALALAQERDSLFLSVWAGQPVDARAAQETDGRLVTASTALERLRRTGATVDSGIVRDLVQALPAMRVRAAYSLSLPVGSEERMQAAAGWFDDASAGVSQLFGSRLRLLSQSGGAGANLFGLYYLRSYALILIDELMKHAALLEGDLLISEGAAGRNIRMPRSGTTGLVRPLPDIAAAAAPYEEFVELLAQQGVLLAEGVFNSEAYAKAEQGVRDALRQGSGLEEAVSFWKEISTGSIARLDALQLRAFSQTRDRLLAAAATARQEQFTWAGIALCVFIVAALSVWVVVSRVVGPLERMRRAMLRLADDDLGVELPKGAQMNEIRAMDDALRVFKVNATRRQRLQNERLLLHKRLEETYSHLRNDLEAAAGVQSSLLPQARELGGIALYSYFRPSHFLAGDTYDVLQQADGKIIVFQIDVVGHGVAAALASVASKYSVAQAILQREGACGVADLVQKINRGWSDDLPYFTLILAEIDPVHGCGTLVQSGHPSPILLKSDGRIEVLGTGGLPIGVFEDATFDTVPFPFGPGDRLLIATDGVHETLNREGEIFAEERLHDLLRTCASRPSDEILSQLETALRSWRGAEELDDDVTVVILEGKKAHGHSRGAARRLAYPEAAERAS